MPLALGLSLLISAAIGSPAAASTTPVINTDIPQAQTLTQYVHSYFKDIPVMADIAQCESHFHQYDANGSLFRGEINHSDVGVMQINEYYHDAEAKAMGIDLATLNGNLKFARHLYETEGTAPWNSSKGCWGSTKDALALNTN